MGSVLTFPVVLLIMVVLAVAGYFIARSRAQSIEAGLSKPMHSRPTHHAMNAALSTAVPALVLTIIWLFGSALVSNIYLDRSIPDDLQDVQLPQQQREGLTEAEIEIREGVLRTQFTASARTLAQALDQYVAEGNISEEDLSATRADLVPLQNLMRAQGLVVGGEVTPGLLRTAQDLRSFDRTAGLLGPLLVLIVTLVGFAWSLKNVVAEFRARTMVERWTLGFLSMASTAAILTTAAILASITLPSLAFFAEYGFFKFLFGFEWAPAGDVTGLPEGDNGEYESALGFMPLIWGTLYISLVALLVSVPLGLLSAVYLSEFASKPVRSWVKPALEVLAGVPTIVYGIFALLTVGPFLQSVVTSTVMPNTVSVVTAGTVMGMMLVPFISSLSDDVMNAVPQAMRDGSLGLGATQAETVTKVILPAALPGIVGAIVLAASRAIGETMIVVLAAGALSNVQGLEPNPFGAVVTVTTRIVAVLTGEGSGFDSIDVLAVFALAFTLFFITLGLNLLAQRMVAKYREQYD